MGIVRFSRAFWRLDISDDVSGGARMTSKIRSWSRLAPSPSQAQEADSEPIQPGQTVLRYRGCMPMHCLAFGLYTVTVSAMNPISVGGSR